MIQNISLRYNLLLYNTFYNFYTNDTFQEKRLFKNVYSYYNITRVLYYNTVKQQYTWNFIR